MLVVSPAGRDDLPHRCGDVLVFDFVYLVDHAVVQQPLQQPAGDRDFAAVAALQVHTVDDANLVVAVVVDVFGRGDFLVAFRLQNQLELKVWNQREPSWVSGSACGG